MSPEKGLLAKWDQAGPRLAWKATGLGAGFSTVSIANGHIFTSGDKADVNYVVCLKESDGSQVWTAKLGKSGAPGWGGFAGPRATPTIDADRVYAVDQWGELVCLETATGKEIWRKDYGKDFGAQRPEWGFSESPLVDGDNLIVTPGGAQGTVVALNKRTGAVVWRTTGFTDAAHYSSIIKAEIAGVAQYVQLTANSLVGISPKEGSLLWKTERKGKTAVIPDPVVSEEHVYVTSGYGAGCDLFKVTRSDGKFATSPVYRENKDMENHHGGVVLVDGCIYGYADRKGWTCQDLLTGQVKWVDKSLGKGSIVYADGKLILRQEDKAGTIVLVEASSTAYKEISRFDQPERSGKNSWPHPVVAGGKLYIRDQDLLLCYQVK
jgi:outer membrane protein assembly factor BamB